MSKKSEKVQENLQVSEKSSTFVAGIVMRRVYQVCLSSQDFGESQTIPGQDVSIATLLERYQNGQIIRIHQRPMNIVSEDDLDEPDNLPLYGDVIDIADIEELQERNNERRAELKERARRAKEVRNEEKPKENEEPPTTQSDAYHYTSPREVLCIPSEPSGLVAGERKE